MQISTKKNTIFIYGMIIGALIFLGIYGFDILNFTNDSLIINGYIEKDVAQHYTGWLLYRNSPWQFPLGVGQNIAYPYGSTVSYTDSIPLFAILFKLLRNFLPSTFQYFGLFVLVCFMLQGGFGAILANLFNENIFIDCIVATIFVFSPIMIERAFRHCALTAHFLILAGLYYYFKNKGECDFKSVFPFFVINAFAITIHPYFLPFTFAIMFAFCVESFFINKAYIKNVIYIILSIVITLFIGYCIGAFYVNGSMSSIGYGMFSMNLNALYNPISKGFSNWSKFLEIKPNVLYQIEGFNYLGLGVILFFVIAIAIFLSSNIKEIFKISLEFIKNHFGLIFSTLALTIFAIGDYITFGGLQIFRLPIPQKLIDGLFGIFRANGRFGWLLVYVIIGFTIYTLINIKNKNISTALLLLLLSIQIYDISDALISKHNYFTNAQGDKQGQKIENIIEDTFWDTKILDFDSIYYVNYPVDNRCIEIAQKAALANKKTNTAFEARVNKPEYESLSQDLYNKVINGQLEKNTLLIFDENDEKLLQFATDNGYIIENIDNLYLIYNK